MFKGKLFGISQPGAFGWTLFKVNWTLVIALLIIVDLWLFGVSIMHSVVNVLHVVIEVIESLSDHFLADVVGLSHHVAETVTAYTGLTIACFVLYKLLGRLYRLSQQIRADVQAYSCQFRQILQTPRVSQHWPVLLATAGAITMAYIFMF